ncbi:polysaccharide biosynthesis/export family protein [Nibricoccus sp. IMCC34717]|uniref:polysaccharide biosynthesis/export family protein n=1 Tax=Nibricoccus sp. IMCC34717 TaxID=3034021 RepID=UPI00385115E6
MPRFRFTFQAVLVAACLVFGGCATDGTTPRTRGQGVPEPGGYAKLRPGDSLVIALQGVPDPTNNNVQVDDRGLVTLPFIGAVQAGGLSTAELGERVRRTYLEKKIYLSVDVGVTATERFVFVGGEVNKPGRILWTPDLTVTKAIQAAGGFTIYARENRLRVIRDEVSYPFDSTLAQKSPDQDSRLAPGDAIQVEKSAF